MEKTDKIQSLMERLAERYSHENQPLESYLEGLLYTEYLDYWHYINTEALLALQHPKTYVKDEMIFIIYHQITELYFKLCLWEYDQILKNETHSGPFLKERIRRIINYFTNLTHSFSIMVDGMDYDQFLQFRLSLLPASGFQSAQYRMIEIASTEMQNLVHPGARENVSTGTVQEKYKFIYWKYGAIISETGEKALTLKRFEEKYDQMLINWSNDHDKQNLLTLYQNLEPEIKNDTELINLYKELDTLVNVNWPLVHYKSAVRYLKQETKEAVSATGGTNWEKYLPPRFQRRIFFPELWSEEELEQWGLRSKSSK